jgi:hypothetical protein
MNMASSPAQAWNARARWSLRILVACLSVLYLALALGSEPVSWGSDGDAYLVGDSALRIQAGTYIPSRLPGNPLHEFLVALVADPRWGTPAKLVSALAAILALATLALLVRRRTRASPAAALLATALFGLWPVWVRATFEVMDYTLGLALFLLSAWFLSRLEDPDGGWHQALGSGVCAGLAVATRLSWVLFVAAALAWLALEALRRPQERRQWLLRAGAFLAGLVAALPFFVPLLARYGLGFLTYYGGTNWSVADYIWANVRMGLDFLGMATQGLLVALLLFVLSRRGSLREWTRGPVWRRALLYSGGLLVVLLLNKPFEAAYLLPLLPLLALALADGEPGTGSDRRVYLRLLALSVVVAAAANVLTADFRWIRGMRTGAAPAGVLEGPVAREWRAQAGDRAVHALMASARHPAEFQAWLKGQAGVDPAAWDAVFLAGYSFYVRRNLWLPHPLTTVAEATLAPGLKRPYLLIVLPYPRFAAQAAELFGGREGRPPGRLLVIFRNGRALRASGPVFDASALKRPPASVGKISVLP